MTEIKFHLYIFEPYSALHGYALDLKKFIVDPNSLTTWIKKAKDYLNRILLTDVLFLYMPSQIALSSLRWAAFKLDIPMNDYMEKRFGESRTTIIEITNSLLKTYEDYIDKSETTTNK